MTVHPGAPGSALAAATVAAREMLTGSLRAVRHARAMTQLHRDRIERAHGPAGYTRRLAAWQDRERRLEAEIAELDAAEPRTAEAQA